MSIVSSPKFAAQADRLESLGDNCEFDFAPRKLGIEHGSLFRWASMKPVSLLALLRNNLKSIYDFESLAPLRPAMVSESTYDNGWNSGIKSVAQPDDCRPEFDRHQRDRRHARQQACQGDLVLLDQSGQMISAAEELVVGDAGLSATLDIEQAGESQYSLTLTTSVEERLQDGERAVIDIAAPEVFVHASLGRKRNEKWNAKRLRAEL